MFYLLSILLILFHTDNDPVIVFVSFDPTTYTVTEGVGGVANLMLVRSGDLARTVVITVTTVAGTATGMTHYSMYTVAISLNGVHMVQTLP